MHKQLQQRPLMAAAVLQQHRQRCQAAQRWCLSPLRLEQLLHAPGIAPAASAARRQRYQEQLW
jgi:hypothetical protein